QQGRDDAAWQAPCEEEQRGQGQKEAALCVPKSQTLWVYIFLNLKKTSQNGNSINSKKIIFIEG
ncbi:MAG: hypothetical protein P8Y45_24000, partial [Exilibacterium sp.]